MNIADFSPVIKLYNWLSLSTKGDAVPLQYMLHL